MEKGSDSKKVWMYAFVFLIFGLVLGLVVFNSNITGNPIFNVNRMTIGNPSIVEPETRSTAQISTSTETTSDAAQAMAYLIQGLSRTTDLSTLSDEDWQKLKEYARFTDIVKKTMNKENIANVGMSGSIQLLNQKLAEAKSSGKIQSVSANYRFIEAQQTTSQTLAASSSGGISGPATPQATILQDGCMNWGSTICCYHWFWGCDGTMG